MLTTEQKARAWDQMKKVWEKGRDDEANDTESRDICRVLAEQMQVIEEKVSTVEFSNLSIPNAGGFPVNKCRDDIPDGLQGLSDEAKIILFPSVVRRARACRRVDEHYIKLKRKANRKIFRSCSPDGKTIIANGQIHTLLANGDVKHDPIPDIGF